MVLEEVLARVLGARSAEPTAASLVAETVTAYADSPMALLLEAEDALGAEKVEAAWAPGTKVAWAAEQAAPFPVLPMAVPLFRQSIWAALTVILGVSVVMPK